MSYQTTKFVDKQVLTHDDMNNIIMGIDESQKFEWKDKTIAFWGDSVTAAGNGDFEYPYTSKSWSNLVGNYFQCAKLYVRGIGGQTFKWGSSGGSVSFNNAVTGQHISRNDSYTYENYEGNISVPEGCVASRGCGCSYLRISTMFPESIRNEIDCVFMIYHNDAATSTASSTVSWVSNSTADPEWAASEFYSKYGGDYNIDSTAGAIASAIMKMQAVLPNAVIVLGTPVAGRGSVGALNPSQSVGGESLNLELREKVLDVGAQFGVPVIDVFGTCGINGLNRDKYISDSIHPNKYGHSMLAKAVIGGLKNISPLAYTNRKPSTIQGTVSFAHSTVSNINQGIDGFKAGATYSYKITPHYTGNLTLYYGYPCYTVATGFKILSSPTAFTGACTANSVITGTFTIPTTLNDSNKEIEIIVIRTNTSDLVTVDYEFTLNE